MNKIVAFIKSEPVALAAVFTALVGAVTAFGLHLTKEQVGAITVAFNAILAVVVRASVAPAKKDATS